MRQGMEEKRYKIIYKGKTAPGQQAEQVKRNLASLLKLSNEKIGQLFSGKPIIIAKDLGHAAAMKYKTAFETAGAICSVEEDKPQKSRPAPSQTDASNVPNVDPSDIIACPKCGFEQEKNEECGRCGIIISKFSDMRESPPPAIPQRTAPLYFSVSTTKLIVMSIFTLGFYEIYWFYKNWNHVKIRTRQKIRPFWRTVFAVFYCYSLFKQVQESVNSNDGRRDINPGWLALGYIVLYTTYNLPDPFWVVSLLSFLPLIPVQGAINNLHATVAPKADRNSNFSVANIVVIIIGGLCLVLATLGMSLPTDFLDGSGQSAWEEFYSEDANFTVAFPGSPEEETENIKTQVGTIKRQSFIAEDDGGRTSFLVMCINYPSGLVEAANYDQILNSIRDELMATYRGQVYQEDSVQMDNYPGREFNFEGKWKNSPVYGNAMSFLIEDRLFLLMALGIDEAVDEKDVERFFVSFESLN